MHYSAAKCKLCESIIKPTGRWDVVSCNCGEVSIDYQTGQMHAKIKKNPANLILVDDEGSEIIPKRKEKEESEEDLGKPTKDEMLDMLDSMRKNIEDLPPNAQLAPVTHSDFASLILLLSSIFRSV